MSEDDLRVAWRELRRAVRDSRLPSFLLGVWVGMCVMLAVVLIAGL